MPPLCLAGIAALFCLPLALRGPGAGPKDADFEELVRPLFAAHCVECHGGARPKGRVDLTTLERREHLLARPALIEKLIGVLGASEMPPEGRPALREEDRLAVLAQLEAWLRESTAGQAHTQLPIRRLNRFQYSNSVKDLLELKTDVFRLPEKLMTRSSDYLSRPGGRMPDRIEAACLSLEVGGGMQDVDPYPKDLRAAHGFDNQADQLGLSPLLLDTLLRLSLSIVESPDFRRETVGIWDEFFKAPAEGIDLEAELRRRLRPFLCRAFRRPITDEALDRYTSYARSQLDAGGSFEEVMKKVAAATLSSPLFLFLYEREESEPDPIALASRLSYFLWGSGPSLELLRSAERGELSRPEVLRETVDGMLADPRIERFLDAFPAQWLQLENVFAATPDPGAHPVFHLDKRRPASLQMVLEPLLLFDALFVEDRPIVELIAPEFSYQSRFLDSWYRSELKPPPVDPDWLAGDNAARSARIAELDVDRNARRNEAVALVAALPERVARTLESIDLAPGRAAWEAEQARLLEVSVVLSTWHRIGPFGATDFNEAHAREFLDPADLDLQRTHGELAWSEVPGFVDGKGHTLTGASCATYLRRTIQASSARPLEVALGTDDSFKVWLDGALVAENKITRGLAPAQDRFVLDLHAGENELLLKVVNGGGGYGFHFQANARTLPGPVLTALREVAPARTEEQRALLVEYYRSIAPELAPLRKAHAAETVALAQRLKKAEDAWKGAPRTRTMEQARQDAQRRYDDEMRGQVRSRVFERVAVTDPRYGGVLTNAAVMSMTSGPERTHPIARGAWVIEVILNDPPEPPPNNVPPLDEEDTSQLTIRERFVRHRADPSCAGCHASIDPLGFALENYGVTGRWRDVYDNGRDVDASGALFRRHAFDGAVQFKESLVREERRFAEAFAGHLLRFALSRELGPADWRTIEAVVEATKAEGFRLRSLVRAVATSEAFAGTAE